jgi:hypothetical protein
MKGLRQVINFGRTIRHRKKRAIELSDTFFLSLIVIENATRKRRKMTDF